MPKRNFVLRVLWRNRTMPAHIPAAPKQMLTANKIASGTRRRRERAQNLSHPHNRKAIKEEISRIESMLVTIA